MDFELNQHVNLHVMPTNKYKTVRILVRFTTPLSIKTTSKRSLLASLMEANSLKFKNRIAINKKLSELYGASFGIGVNSKGNDHYFTIGMTIINDQLVPNGISVLASAVEFLQEIIFNPNIINGVFEQETFHREKENLTEYINSLFDDKQTYAALSLQELFFKESTNQKIPSFGSVSQIENETNKSIASYYQQMINNDKIDIMVIGDVAEKYVARCFNQFGFSDRLVEQHDLFYHQPFQNIIQQKTEKLPVIQSKLNLAYHCDIYYFDTLYFPLMVFNGLFGGFPHSKLFLNVREKNSLAYYASSSIDPFRGLLTVQTGIDAKNRKNVLHLISQQLKELAAGKVTEDDLEQTKVMLINQYLLGLDSQRLLLEQNFLTMEVPDAKITQDEWIGRVNAVTIEHLKEVAKHIRLQAVYFMEGEDENK